MDSEDRKILQHISDNLDEVLVIMKKPENKFIRALEIGSMVVGILAILGIADAIFQKFFGG